METPAAILYVAGYKWPFRLIAIALAVLLIVLRPGVRETWESSGWFFGVGIAFIYVLALLGLLETFLRRTWFTERGIHYRSLFGRTTFVAYGKSENS